MAVEFKHRHKENYRGTKANKFKDMQKLAKHIMQGGQAATCEAAAMLMLLRCYWNPVVCGFCADAAMLMLLRCYSNPKSSLPNSHPQVQEAAVWHSRRKCAQACSGKSRWEKGVRRE